MLWKISQIKLLAGDDFEFTRGFNLEYLHFGQFNADVLTARSTGESFTLTATGEWIEFEFHVLAWCGSIKVELQDSTYVISLYAAEHGFKRVRVLNPGSGTFRVQVTNVTATDTRSLDVQLWFTGVVFSERQPWLPRSMPVSPVCTLTEGRYGTFLTLTSDTVIGAAIANSGSWADHDLNLMRPHISPGMTVIDVGANIGHHTVAFSKMVGLCGRVVAFEPQEQLFRLLAANCLINGCRNVEMKQCCVGREAAAVKLYPIDYSKPGNFGRLGVDPDPESRLLPGELCRADCLDHLLGELPLTAMSIDFIKIDVQSYELFVLQGAQETLLRCKPTLFLEIAPYWMSKFYDYRKIYELLWGLGYEIEHVSDPSVPKGQIKHWDGSKSEEEWDILARHHR